MKTRSFMISGAFPVCKRLGFPIVASLICVLLFSRDAGADNSGADADPTNDQWEFLDNGTIRIGVDKLRGGCIGFFGESKTERNVLNHYDHGRFIQQSYYGDPDASDWNGKPWRYNPIQGGSWRGKDARVLDFSIDVDSGLYAKVEPRHWANGKACPEAIMEQWITLDGPIAKVRCRMTYTGEDHDQARHQEMPAVFVDAVLKHLVYVQQEKLIRRVPGWPNESGSTSEDWVAYVDDKDWGLGILTPGTSEFTCYRHKGNGESGPRGSACSYVAPIRTLRLQGGQVVEYEFYLTLGSLKEIRRRFTTLQQENQEAANAEEDRPNIR
ncbi:MAG: hypothetical protein P8L85_10140 [Rubripirellula sp.]|nr:hypothetical protein [Rubripirellula sp.]